VLLGDALDLLTVLAPSKIAISLDAASAEIHDHIRGVAGAWAATVAAIKRAIKILTPQTRLAVSSVLLPGKRHHLDGLSARLSEIGIDRWIVNPLLRVGADHIGGPVQDRASLFDDLLILQEAADRVGIRLTIDDEFDHLGHSSGGRPSACAPFPSRANAASGRGDLPFGTQRSVLDRQGHSQASDA
jgi:MoaA/NifB/PqqE/SkfB family radical SAM enzyme